MAQGARKQRSVVDRRKLVSALGVGAAAVGGLMPRGSAAHVLERAVAMRRSDRAVRRVGDGRGGMPAVPSGAVVALNRMGFGPGPGDIDAFDALGATDAQRLAAYVTQQLDPATIDDSEVETRIAGAGFESVGLDSDPDAYLAILWDWYVNGNSPGGHGSSWPRDELIRTTFMRAAYSKRQLLELVVEFWRDHFNVNTDVSSWIRATVPHLDAVIRIEAFGNFRVLLEAVARSPAMLRYLDNYTSSNAGPNENFSRELFELHGLGAENYLGILPQSEVPVDGEGRPIGYVDADVFESVRAFTGWSFSNGTESDGDTGLFYYRGPWHDRFQKFVLGIFLPQDQPDLKDGRDVLDAIASHPGTGRHIARKLCRRLIADDPPQGVVDAAAAVFTAQWEAPDQIQQVLQTILLAPEFLATWGEKTKRPFETAVSALRAGGADFTLRMDDGDTSTFSLALRGHRAAALPLAPAEGLPRRARSLEQHDAAGDGLEARQLAHRLRRRRRQLLPRHHRPDAGLGAFGERAGGLLDRPGLRPPDGGGRSHRDRRVHGQRLQPRPRSRLRRSGDHRTAPSDGRPSVHGAGVPVALRRRRLGARR